MQGLKCFSFYISLYNTECKMLRNEIRRSKQQFTVMNWDTSAIFCPENFFDNNCCKVLKRYDILFLAANELYTQR